jgi:epoxyqueuosine reductase
MMLAEQIKAEARRVGFDVVGIARVDSRPDARSSSDGQGASFRERLHHRLLAWLNRGHHGQMSWMARDPQRRSDPQQVLPGCRSVICVGLNYYTETRADESPGHGRLARYAWGQDYHRLFADRLAELERAIQRLAPSATTRWYVDTGPIMEKAWAQEAGLGWIGKHTNLVSPRYGSWLLLGEVLTTLDLPADEPGSDLCGTCTLCLRACPTGAITEPYVLDARRCISYLTIELHGPDDVIPEDLASKLGNRIFGCDDCLDVCPYNIQTVPTTEEAFQPSTVTLAPKLDVLAKLTEPEFTNQFRHSPVRRAKHHGFLRNVGVALRNLISSNSQSSIHSSPR